MPEVKIYLESAEEEAVERLVQAGLLTSWDEAVRAAILKVCAGSGAPASRGFVGED